MIKKWIRDKRLWGAVVGLALLTLLVMQIVPIEKTNPPVKREPSWDSAQTRALAEDACFDCHSNETEWPWYSDISPMRVLVRDHVIEGREKVNFSELDNRVKLDELIEVVEEGEMPPWDYEILHPEARLTDEQKDQLIEGFKATFASSANTSFLIGSNHVNHPQ